MRKSSHASSAGNHQQGSAPLRSARRTRTGAYAGVALAAFLAVVALTGADDETLVVVRAPAPTSLEAGALAAAPKVSPRPVGQVSRLPGPAVLVALTADRVVVLDPVSGAQRKVLAIHPPGRDKTPVTLQGLAVTPDGRHAYYAVVTNDQGGTIYRVAIDGESPPQNIGNGISPAVSPDGRHLAYAAPGPSDPDGPDVSGRCCNTIMVADLDTDTTQRKWRHPDADLPGGDWFGDASFTKLAWAPDSRRLAFTVSYEGDTIAVLDTAAHRDLSETVEVVVPDGGGDSRHPTWHAASDRLAIVNQAFECCFEDDYAGPPRSLLVDVTRRLADALLPPDRAPTWLDFDATGEHLLFVENGHLYRRSHGETPVQLASRIRAADW